ncbi:hypothetical protein GCM10027066_33730 [Dyella jejuensis]
MQLANDARHDGLLAVDGTGKHGALRLTLTFGRVQSGQEMIQVAKELSCPKFDINRREKGRQRGVAKRAVIIQEFDLDVARNEVIV